MDVDVDVQYIHIILHLNTSAFVPYRILFKLLVANRFPIQWETVGGLWESMKGTNHRLWKLQELFTAKHFGEIAKIRTLELPSRNYHFRFARFSNEFHLIFPGFLLNAMERPPIPITYAYFLFTKSFLFVHTILLLFSHGIRGWEDDEKHQKLHCAEVETKWYDYIFGFMTRFKSFR